MDSSAHDLNTDALVLIVVGAHLRAERDDRPLAYRLHDLIDQRLRALCGDESGAKGLLTPMVCTDVWYLNNHELAGRPAIALGEPGVNAATAYLSNRLPTAFIIDNTLRMHLDPEFIDVQACIWGVNPAATASAVDLFVERYLEDFLRQALDASE